MPLPIKAGDVRRACRDLRKATSVLKNALKKANKSQSHDDWATVELSRDELEEEMGEVTVIIRRASAKGLSIHNLSSAMVEAEAAIGDQGQRQVVVLPPAMASVPTNNFSPRQGEGDGALGNFTGPYLDAPPPQGEEEGDERRGGNTSPPPPSPSPAGAITPNVVVLPEVSQSTPSLPRSGGSGSRHSVESRQLDDEFERAREEADIAAAETASLRAGAAAKVAEAGEKDARARALFNERRRDIQRRQAALNDVNSQRLSSGSGHSDRQVRVGDIPTHLITEGGPSIRVATPLANLPGTDRNPRRPVTPPRRPATPPRRLVTPPRPVVVPPMQTRTDVIQEPSRADGRYVPRVGNR